MKNLKKFLCLGLCLTTLFGSVLTSEAATVSGTYPTRRGTILVTSDAYKNLIPTGHAAIVWDSSTVVESISSGVVVGRNNWTSNKKKIYGVSVSSTTAAQDSSVASWCRSQVGKSYNYNYLNVTTRKKFYCSQLVWAGYRDLYGIDLNTSTFGKAIHPMELVNSSQTYTFYTYKK